MSWITILWPMGASACLTLAAIHLQIWCRRRRVWADLLFSLASTATAALAGCEFWMMRAETPAQFATAVRWLHVPAWVIVLSLVGFVRLYLRAGRRWLAWLICALRTLVLPLDFLIGQNLNYLETVRLRHIRFLGESISFGEGISNPWMLVGQLALVLWVIFCMDAAITVWRRGDKRQALTTGTGLVFFTMAGTVQSILVLWQIVEMPIMASFFFMGFVAAMAYDMSYEMLQAAQLSENLRESEARYRNIFEGAIEGMFRTSAQGKCVVANPALAKMLGYDSADEVISAIQDSALQVWADPDERSRSLRQLEEQGTLRGYECQFKRKDGTTIWVSLNSHAVRRPDGQVAYYEGFLQDLTTRRQSEQEIARQRNELAHLSRVAALGELANSFAHELNQPLASILSNSQAAQRLLARDPADLDEVRKILADIVADDKRAGEVIRSLRALLKRGEMHRQPLDASELILLVLKLVRMDLVNQGVTAKTDLAPNLPVFHGDHVQLQQVLINLVMNACDAMACVPRNDREIRICSGLNGSSFVRISVVDRGTGIAPEKMDKVFEPFYTTKPDGTGLGLAVCRKIVVAHGGSLWAANNPERGATFHLTLPLSGEREKVMEGSPD
ncbi:MAG TPA: ATP-binding protein [Acidobacteriota bacterium]|nr:ATP-binding protein [Acidobacteriota bacterium]